MLYYEKDFFFLKNEEQKIRFFAFTNDADDSIASPNDSLPSEARTVFGNTVFIFVSSFKFLYIILTRR
jgi:hypothetical protein